MKYFILPLFAFVPIHTHGTGQNGDHSSGKKSALTQTVRTYGTIFTQKQTDISAQVAGVKSPVFCSTMGQR